jgi:hypothetical protein
MLLVGWMFVLVGVGTCVFSGRSGLKTGAYFVLIGVAYLVWELRASGNSNT